MYSNNWMIYNNNITLIFKKNIMEVINPNLHIKTRKLNKCNCLLANQNNIYINK